MKDYKLLLFILTMIFCTSCQKELDPIEYVGWVKNEENGLRKIKKVGDYIFDVQYKPIPFIVANYLRKNEIGKETFAELYEQYKGVEYYNLVLDVVGNQNITAVSVSELNPIEDRIQYLSFGLQHDIYLMYGEEKIPCSIYHFERNYNIKKSKTILLGFDTKESVLPQSKTLVIDSPLFDVGKVKIRFEEKDLKNIPNIHLK